MVEDLRPESIGASRFERRLYGVFREPLWYRLPLACIALAVAYPLLSAAAEMTASRDWRFIVVAMVGLEPIGAFMALMTGALVLPRTAVLRWFEARKRATLIVIVLWFVAFAVISLLMLLQVLR